MKALRPNVSLPRATAKLARQYKSLVRPRIHAEKLAICHQRRWRQSRSAAALGLSQGSAQSIATYNTIIDRPKKAQTHFCAGIVPTSNQPPTPAIQCKPSLDCADERSVLTLTFLFLQVTLKLEYRFCQPLVKGFCILS